MFSAVGNSTFGLVRSTDGFDSVVDKNQTLEMMLKELEYDANKQPYEIRIVTADEEKYEIEPATPDNDAEKDEKAKIIEKEQITPLAYMRKMNLE